MYRTTGKRQATLQENKERIFDRGLTVEEIRLTDKYGKTSSFAVIRKIQSKAIRFQFLPTDKNSDTPTPCS